MTDSTAMKRNGEGPLVTDLFNSAITAFAIVAAWELGVLDEIEVNGYIDLQLHARKHDLHEPSLRAIVSALACSEIVELTSDGSRANSTGQFDSVYETKGFYTWLFGGCGELLRTAGVVSQNSQRKGSFIHRDARAIGLGTGDFGARFIDPLFEDAFSNVPFSVIADLGCGSGDRLIRLLANRPGATGVGIDISEAAVELSRERIATAGLSDRAFIVLGDVRNLSRQPYFEGVDFLTCFLMGHDFWPREKCIGIMRTLREVFPSVATLALCDTYRSEVIPSNRVPLVSLGFEFVHALMGQYVPTIGEWRDAFLASGWHPIAEHDITVPAFTKIFHLVPS